MLAYLSCEKLRLLSQFKFNFLTTGNTPGLSTSLNIPEGTGEHELENPRLSADGSILFPQAVTYSIESFCELIDVSGGR